MAKATTNTCCLTLPLILEKWQSDKLEKRFEIARQIYNTLLNYELKKLRRLEQSDEYSDLQARIQDQLSQEKRDAAELKKLLSKISTNTSMIISVQMLPYTEITTDLGIHLIIPCLPNSDSLPAAKHWKRSLYDTEISKKHTIPTQWAGMKKSPKS